MDWGPRIKTDGPKFADREPRIDPDGPDQQTSFVDEGPRINPDGPEQQTSLVDWGLRILIILVILISYRRKSAEATQSLKNIPGKMNNLEPMVPANGNETPAELQNKIIGISSELRKMVPSVEKHSVVQWARQDSVEKEKERRLAGRPMMHQLWLTDYRTNYSICQITISKN